LTRIQRRLTDTALFQSHTEREDRRMRLSDVPLPTTPVCRQALAVLTRFSPPALVNHCVRSYVLAASRATIEGLEVDHELLYVAALLHDLGLEATFDSHRVAFEEAGGNVAWVFTAGAGWPAERSDRAAQIIVAHMQGADVTVDPEGHLLDLATGLDISGRGGEHWPDDLLRELVSAYPRLDLGPRFTACITDQADRKPGSSAAGVVERGIVEGIASNPLDRL
jgi:hypothetical protein